MLDGRHLTRMQFTVMLDGEAVARRTAQQEIESLTGLSFQQLLSGQSPTVPRHTKMALAGIPGWIHSALPYASNIHFMMYLVYSEELLNRLIN